LGKLLKPMSRVLFHLLLMLEVPLPGLGLSQ
jgi:hypothetical protein